MALRSKLKEARSDSASPAISCAVLAVSSKSGAERGLRLKSSKNDLSDAAEMDSAGRLLVDKMLRICPRASTTENEKHSPSFEKGTLYALGDNAAIIDNAVPSTAQVAFQQSEYAAWNVWASLSGEKNLAFRFIPLGEMLTLGADDAAISAESLLGPELGGAVAKLGGPMASLARRAIYAARMPTAEQQMIAALGISQGPLKRLLGKTLDAATQPRKN